MSEQVNMDLLRRFHELPAFELDERCVGCPYGGYIPRSSPVGAGEGFCVMGAQQLDAEAKVVGLLKLDKQPNAGCPAISCDHETALIWNPVRIARIWLFGR